MEQIVIGVTCGIKENKLILSNDIAKALNELGAICTPVPYDAGKEALERLISACDGFVFSGGGDIHPSYYGQEPEENIKNICSIRDSLEHYVFKLVFDLKKPVLGICRGMQVINVFLGGTLRQHIDGHFQSSPRDEGSHKVIFTRNDNLVNLVYSTYGQKTAFVNSFHYQCVDKLAPPLVCDAISEDGITEAYHLCEKGFLIGVQWHPECTFWHDDLSMSIFRSFIDECKKRGN